MKIKKVVYESIKAFGPTRSTARDRNLGEYIDSLVSTGYVNSTSGTPTFLQSYYYCEETYVYITIPVNSLLCSTLQPTKYPSLSCLYVCMKWHREYVAVAVPNFQQPKNLPHTSSTRLF